MSEAKATDHPAEALEPWQDARAASAVADALEQRLAELGSSATVRSVRFVPSTAVRSANGDVEMIANTIVDVKSTPGVRPEVLESVVTLASRPRSSPLKRIVTHALDRQTNLREQGVYA